MGTRCPEKGKQRPEKRPKRGKHEQNDGKSGPKRRNIGTRRPEKGEKADKRGKNDPNTTVIRGANRGNIRRKAPWKGNGKVTKRG